ncbi:MAG: hypothetical protein K6E53_11050 [Lachnospiraceae bacterium]|nr:hypothetical protein [Lachnospiraceae bacterium]
MAFNSNQGNSRKINLFVPGRLCLFGEHSDWAGMYRTVNSEIVVGQAVVTGIEQGIYATVEKCDRFIVESKLPIYGGEYLECPMDTAELLEVAKRGGFFSYVAGVASYINDNYTVGGVKINVTKMDLPIKSGLSSSAAVCVLVARAFNQLYNLRMNTKGEMQAAFRGEQRTPSRCGRLDQACAYGVKPVLMEFDGVEVDSKELSVGTTFRWVIANLNASKDTIKILADLNRCYPFAESEEQKRVQEALGIDNKEINEKAIKLLEDGDAKGLGALMDEWQANFDEKVMPACTELIAPVLHSVLGDEEVRKYIYGAKGVGSQGDGSVQFLCRDEESVRGLQYYLKEKKGMPSFTLTLKPGQSVRKAVIPLAGYGTRIFPATKIMKKGFVPVVDKDGMLKPAIFIMLEELFDAGIEEVCLIIGEDEQEDYDRLFEPVSDEVKSKLPLDRQEYADRIVEMRQHITFVHQRERRGFGHAVYLTRQFAGGAPVLLLLGDFIYETKAAISCSRQVIDAYMECGKTLVSVEEVPLERVVHYGILYGQWDNTDETMMKVESMVEKPTDDYAEEYLGVVNNKKQKKYYATFGQYVLTPEVYDELAAMVITADNEGLEGEIGLTEALDIVRSKYGMYAFKPEGISYDLGLPEAYRYTISQYGLN